MLALGFVFGEPQGDHSFSWWWVGLAFVPLALVGKRILREVTS